MKKKVSHALVRHILGGLCELYDDEVVELIQRDAQDEKELRRIIQQFIVPQFQEHSYENQKMMMDTLEYYLASNSPEINRFLGMFGVPIDPPSGREFFSIVWQRLFATPIPVSINVDDYEVDHSFDLEIVRPMRGSSLLTFL